jgi:hypothetical protein
VSGKSSDLPVGTAILGMTIAIVALVVLAFA